MKMMEAGVGEEKCQGLHEGVEFETKLTKQVRGQKPDSRAAE